MAGETSVTVRRSKWFLSWTCAPASRRRWTRPALTGASLEERGRDERPCLSSTMSPRTRPSRPAFNSPYGAGPMATNRLQFWLKTGITEECGTSNGWARYRCWRRRCLQIGLIRGSHAVAERQTGESVVLVGEAPANLACAAASEPVAGAEAYPDGFPATAALTSRGRVPCWTHRDGVRRTPGRASHSAPTCSTAKRTSAMTSSPGMATGGRSGLGRTHVRAGTAWRLWKARYPYNSEIAASSRPRASSTQRPPRRDRGEPLRFVHHQRLLAVASMR